MDTLAERPPIPAEHVHLQVAPLTATSVTTLRTATASGQKLQRSDILFTVHKPCGMLTHEEVLVFSCAQCHTGCLG